jgi:hypothetical protein
VLEATREVVCVEENTKKTKYMVMSHHQNAGQNHNLLINKYSANVTKFKYLGPNITNQTCIHKEIKSRFNSGNACYHFVRSFFFQSPL